jgi:hypothetical protein
MATGRSALDGFRAAVLGDAALQEELRAEDDVEEFAARAVEAAAKRGFSLSADEMKRAMRADPLGLARWSEAQVTSGASPQPGWLPIHIGWQQGVAHLDWAYFGEEALTESFFEASVRRALRRPLNRLVRLRTPLAELPRWVEHQPGLRPNGFIFHMSRCGSTLVSQMLAADPRNIVVSEASVIDTAVQIAAAPAGSMDDHAALLAAVIGALGHKRAPSQCRYFIKLDSWHTIALPLFRLAFPSVPWIFLYRARSSPRNFASAGYKPCRNISRPRYLA